MVYSFTSSQVLRLDEFLRQNLHSHIKKDFEISKEQVSNSKIRRLIISGCVSVNSKVCRRPAFELRGHSLITVDFEIEKFFFEKQPDDISFEVTQKDIIYEDEYLICVNKPALFPTEETIVGGQKRDNLHDAVVRYLWSKNPKLPNPPYAGIMHRLDRETSGVILFTKQRSVNKAIQEAFSTHSIVKQYIAVTRYKNDIKPNFTVEMFMNRISSKSQACKWGRVPESKGGLYSKTDFMVLSKKTINSKTYLMVKADIYTGRTHQIRVHLSSLGLPILGDELYGGDSYNRIMLHSVTIRIKHPVSGKILVLNAPLPF